MAKRSPLFLAAAGMLLVLNLGLGFAVVNQHQALEVAEAQGLLESERDQLKARVAVADEILASLSTIQTSNDVLDMRIAEIRPRLYDPEERAGVEIDLTQAIQQTQGRGEGISLQQIKVSMTQERKAFKRWTYTLLLQGKGTLLPPLTERIYKDAKLALVGRVAASSPNFTFRDLDMAVDIHYFQPQYETKRSNVRQAVNAAFEVPRSQHPQLGAESLTPISQEIASLRQRLEAAEPQLLEAATLEAESRQMTEIIEAYNDLLKTWRRNQQQIEENLPKLYLRVRGSTLGGAALVLDGEDVTFPDYTGEE